MTTALNIVQAIHRPRSGKIFSKKGSTFTVEVLGCHTEDDALALAQHYAALWGSTINLYRVPFVHTGSDPWAEDQMQFIYRVEPNQPELNEAPPF